ncbi:peptidylprolyl isomerase [Blastococcus sp. MG754426]|uniref:peptidylprolyl isomerase n=1 Tax=unclassified Blastococcus TaxID=2619396 RepID=UPI001EEFA396|nr:MULTISPECIES: peptidylprolyl isomerase [unclassified Blastococcus]MCF6507549.1 peptidylprolyl isomerase [Blastococcus sp. MG754426]MCF6512067.1 peptidylprolyl isomerase [Blastococcus sp. MG754427]MCF6735062.1 peptidylprolyl isomerase [Blastococcus sp. KM273129]
MPTNKQRREAAQRHLQRQLERRAEQAKKRRRNLGLLLAALAVVVVAGVALLVTGVFGGDDPTDDLAAEPTTPAATSSAARTTNADGTVTCEYLPDESGNTNLTDVGTPPNPEATPTQGTATVLMSTNQGDVTLTLDRAQAPCAAASFVYLTEQGFYDGTPCHRLVDAETFGVLQCGDPTGTGSGGPSYKYAEEVTPDTTYPRGTVAMAKTAAPNSTGGQFFLTFVDTELPPEYTVVGTVDEAGLGVLDAVAAGGVQGAEGPGDGAPNIPVTIEDASVVG